jgi:hypothetical protein
MKQKHDEIEGVILGSWRGVEQYRCRLCQFDTLEKQQFIDHFANMHAPLEVIDGGKKNEPEPSAKVATEKK